MRDSQTEGKRNKCPRRLDSRAGAKYIHTIIFPQPARNKENAMPEQDSPHLSSTYEEVFELSGPEVISKLKEIFHQLESALKEGAGGAKQVLREGMIRRVIIQNESGKEIFSAPVNVGVGVGLVGLIAAPLIAAAAGIVLVAKRCRLIVVREKNSEDPASSTVDSRT